MNHFSFSIHKTCSKTGARTGLIQTPHGSIQTPVFMPVGTKASVKGVSHQELIDIGFEIILANTYHLAMRPGSEHIAGMGGLHAWTAWPKAFLTDSGGFQVFSLASRMKITDEGVAFQSHVDGSRHFLTPEKAIAIQEELAPDIMMAFDECAPAGVDKDFATKAMNRTHQWMERCAQSHTKKNISLFPIIQGSRFEDLRQHSAKTLLPYADWGIAIGGVSVGEAFHEKFFAIESAISHIPKEKAVYLMGLGHPLDLLEGIERGVDMFDCVLATRIARHGTFWDFDGQHAISNLRYAKDPEPLVFLETAPELQHYSKSYLHHLMKEKELMALRILSLHNLAFLHQLMKDSRRAIEEDRFPSFKADFIKRFFAQQSHRNPLLFSL